MSTLSISLIIAGIFIAILAFLGYRIVKIILDCDEKLNNNQQ